MTEDMSEDGIVLDGRSVTTISSSIGAHDFQSPDNRPCQTCNLPVRNPIHHASVIVQSVRSFEAGKAFCRDLIAQRLKRHRDNLAGWSEGERCSCYSIHRSYGQVGERPRETCALCNGGGVKAGTKGYLLPTEPDPEERALVRMRLKVAIDAGKEIG